VNGKEIFQIDYVAAFYKEAHCCVPVYDFNGMVSFDMLDN